MCGVGTESLNDAGRHEGVGACGELIAAALFIDLAEGDGAGLAVGSREDGVVQSLITGWLCAVPVAFVLKAIAVAVVIMPVGGWLAFDAPTAVADLGGILAAVALWRTLLLNTIS